MDNNTLPTSQPVATDSSVATEVRSVWSELLFVDPIDDLDNFVALGGDSIAATLCSMRINTAFGVELPATVLLSQDTTLAMVVRQIEALLEAAPR
jgi:acyl carrier protein